jgi:integrase
LTPNEVASLLKISPASVYRHARELGGFYLPGMSVLRFNAGVIYGLLEAKEGMALRVREGGSLEPRYIPINKTLHGTLWQLWRRREQEQWVFWNKKEKNRYNRRPKLMRSLCKRANVSHYGFHCIRHYVATLLHDSLKIPTGVIGGLLGHQSKRTTEIYLHSVDESAKIAMERLENCGVLCGV